MRDSPCLMALDWGTSSVRAFLLAPDGTVLDTRAEPWGIMHVPDGDFAAAFATLTGPWRDRFPGLKAIASGMIGSAQGWREAPYCEAPAGVAELTAALVTAETGNGPLHIVPGVRRGGTNPNVMRGEETQILGALSLTLIWRRTAWWCCQGTHSKWVAVQEACITDFTTYMTGELFALLREHSILGRPAKAAQSEAGRGDRLARFRARRQRTSRQRRRPVRLAVFHPHPGPDGRAGSSVQPGLPVWPADWGRILCRPPGGGPGTDPDRRCGALRPLSAGRRLVWPARTAVDRKSLRRRIMADRNNGRAGMTRQHEGDTPVFKPASQNCL